jgi:hypothetical protein
MENAAGKAVGFLEKAAVGALSGDASKFNNALKANAGTNNSASIYDGELYDDSRAQINRLLEGSSMSPRQAKKMLDFINESQRAGMSWPEMDRKLETMYRDF